MSKTWFVVVFHWMTLHTTQNQNLAVFLCLQSCMRSSSPEPKRSGGATVKPVRSTTARAVRRWNEPRLSYSQLKTWIKTKQPCHADWFLWCVSLLEGASLADRESSLDLIKLDISRTFPSLFIFQKVTDHRPPLLPRMNLPSRLSVNLKPLLSAGGSLPRPPPQCPGGLHLLQTWHRLRESRLQTELNWPILSRREFKLVLTFGGQYWWQDIVSTPVLWYWSEMVLKL